MSMVTVKVSNVSLEATERDLKEFFSFSGEIVYLETQSENEGSKIAYVTFKDLQGAETAVLLTGATIVDSSVTVTMSPDYQLPPEALASIESSKENNKSSSPSREDESVFRKAEDVMVTVKVSNVSLEATERDLKEFFSFSGEIVYLETQSENEGSKIAYVTFKDLQGAETAVLLTGATIVDSSVTVTMSPDYQLPPEALASIESSKESKSPSREDVSVFRKAEDVVSGMISKGFILGKDAVAKAKSLDEKHQLTSTASAKVTSFDKRIGFTEKINTGTTVVSEKVKEVDQKFQVTEKTKSAIAAAEQTVNNAGSAIMKNRYVLTGTTWVTGAFNKVSKAAEEVGQKAKEKVGMAGEEEEEEKKKVVDNEVAGVHSSESAKGLDQSEQDSKLSELQTQMQPKPQKEFTPSVASA